MKVVATKIPDVLLIEQRMFKDERGFFIESWNARTFNQAVGTDVTFVQDNHSRSVRNVLRGLHYQIQNPQGKLVRAATGRVFDVAVDLRRSSATFGCWVGTELTEENGRQIWIPAGFAHGFIALSAVADVMYKTTDYYAPEHERCVAWNDPTIAIAWPLNDGTPILSPKDRAGLTLQSAEVFP